MSQVASSHVAARLASLSAAPRRRDARASRAPATKSRRGAHIVLDASPGGSPPAAVDAVVFTVIVDDLVFPDGTTKMCVMGGGGPQTAFGLRAHPSDLTVGIAAGVGSDLPSECASWLDANAVDTTGLALVRDRAADVDASDAADRWEGGGADPSDFLPRDHPPPPAHLPTPRAWQITEFDGRRTQVWRTQPSPALYAMLRPPASTLPPSYAAARAFHVGVHPERPDLDLLAAIREANPSAVISVEPFTAAVAPVPVDTLRRLCASCDVFSPNELEAASMVGSGEPAELCDRLVAAGAKTVCVRRGELGAVVRDAKSGETWSLPAVIESQADVVDVTGCGNAFCGGFLASVLAGESTVEAAAWGSAAASLMAEAVGVPEEAAGTDRVRAEAKKRAETLKTRAVRIA